MDNATTKKNWGERPWNRSIAAEFPPRHSLVVRLTHWLNTASFFALVLSGVAILLAYPRLHWGETGTVGTPAFIDFAVTFCFRAGYSRAWSIPPFSGGMGRFICRLGLRYFRPLHPALSQEPLAEKIRPQFQHLPKGLY